ncbi:MAG TPA: hypothetical protein VHZ74_15490, partial [Bryobacteraceae bacterium]|nr:hypothetical protein [Bryobacteraceae bacterium]
MQTGVYVLLVAVAWGRTVLAQTPATGTQPADTPTAVVPFGTSPPAVDQRDKEVREVDPLDQSSKEGKKKAETDRKAQKREKPDSSAVPGSIAAEDQDKANQRQGPEVVDEDPDKAPVQEYTGPAVLSRSYSINRPLIPEQVKWEERLGLSSVYDTGIVRNVNPDGTPAGGSTLTGTMLDWFLAGRHYFRRDMVAVEYTGNMTRYIGPGAYSGTNQSVTVDYSHVLSRRLTLNVSGLGSILSQNYSLDNPTVGPGSIANVNLASSPNVEIFDTGTKQFTGTADLTWQKSSRLSFSAGTSYFGIDRNSPELLGVTGQQARGDVNYRLTRKTTVGTYYSFSHYLYPHGFGNSQTNSVGLIYSYAFNRTLQIRFRGGVSRVGSLGLQTVPIDPTLAILLGQASGLIDSSQTFKTTDYSAQLIKDFRSGSTVSFAYARGISPGNGVFQTSQQESITANFTARVFRTYTFSFGGGRDTLKSVAEDLGRYQSYDGRISLGRTYRRGIGLSFTVDYRYFDLAQLGSLRNQLRITS